MNEMTAQQILEATFRVALNDPPGTLAVNGEVDALLGFPAEDYLEGKISLRERIHADDQDLAEILFSSEHQATEGSLNLRLRQANGRIRCCKALYAKSLQAGRSFLNLTLQDAKSLPRTLDDAATTANFVAMMENTNDFIYFKDRNHVFTGASQTLVSITSPAKHWTDLLGQTDYDVFPEEYADLYYRLEKQIFAGVAVAHEIQGYRSNEGLQGWVDNRKYPIRDEQGDIIGLFGIARDITDQSRLESTLLSIANFVSQDHGDRCLDAMVKFTAWQFAVDYVHIALIEPDQSSVRVVAGLLDGKPIDPGYVYPLAGTPCENVTRRAHKCYGDRVQQLFPRDHDLETLRAEGYIGEPIVDNAGQVLGLIVLVSRRALVDSEAIVSGLRILAARAAADLAQQRTALALRREREALQLILDFAPIGIWLQDGKGKLSVVNKAFCSAMGIPAERFLAVPHYAEVIPEAFREQCIASDAKALSSASICDNHQRLPFVDGVIHDLRVIKAVKRDEHGKPEFLVGLSLDITEELRREQALMASAQRFRIVSELTSDLIYSCRRDAAGLFRVDWMGGQAAPIFGRDNSEIMNLGCWRPFVIPEDEHLFRRHVTDLNPGESSDVVLRVTHRDGSLHHIRSVARVEALHDGAGEHVLFGALQDITEQLHQKMALQESEARFRELVESIPGFAYRCKLDADWTMEYFSPGFEVLTGYAIGDFINNKVRSYASIIHPDDVDAVDRAVREGIAHQRPYELEYRIFDAQARTIWVGERGCGHNRADGQTDYLIGVIFDITARKRIEAEIVQHRNNLEAQVQERTSELVEAKIAAEAASRAKSAFLATMSHELRTPMNAILGMTGLVLRQTTDPKLQDQLGKVNQASKHLLAVINDILDISKIEADRMVLEQTPFQLGSVLENLASLAGERAGDKGLRFTIDLPPELASLHLVGDPLRLGQILLNLVGNAIKFTEQGSVTVRVWRQPGTALVARLRFEIEDTGIGVSPLARQRLFTAFEQADKSMTRTYGGTGLGLAISKRLVQLMDGDIDVSSTPGSGSTFWFEISLPLAEDAVTQALTFDTNEVETRIRNGFAGSRVLLAEDEPINREVSLGLLEAVGLHVDVAQDGAEALDLARKQRYALILMDMQMPNLNGVDATRRLRADSLNRDTPVLAMTANAFDEDRNICLAVGMNDHLPKPIDPAVLFETLLKWLEKSRG